jgi:hypothetical protein
MKGEIIKRNKDIITEPDTIIMKPAKSALLALLFSPRDR